MNSTPWWQGAVIYQIYPRSFADSNADGVGDLAGITAKLDYVAKLGVDALWISPFFLSPQKDFGYDVADYCAVDPLFGTLSDAQALIKRAHALGLKVVIDLVLSHSSDQHPWFLESSQNRNNSKADWYVWAEGIDKNTPPNNWLAVFGGSAWQWHEPRQQFYLHNFLREQPDLNLHNPDVQNALLDCIKFWLELGIDGLRLDVINLCMHDKLLRNNPSKTQQQANFNAPWCNPYQQQQHIFDKTRPENLHWLRRLRALANQYSDILLLAEIFDDDELNTAKAYTAGNDLLHSAYTFALMSPTITPTLLAAAIKAYDNSQSWPSWALGNHDNMRVAQRWGGAGAPVPQAKLFLTMAGCLRGSLCWYQGDELALPEAELDYADLQDPYGKEFYPTFKGRDGCRTPMPWQAEAPHLGFSAAAKTWLPAYAGHQERAVNIQENNPDSMLNYSRAFFTFRQNMPLLRLGGLTLVYHDAQILVFSRHYEGEECLCLFNLSEQTAHWQGYVLAPFSAQIWQNDKCLWTSAG